MPLELRKLPKDFDRRGIQPGDKGLLVLAKVRAFRSVNREASKKLRAVGELYYREKCPEIVEKEKEKEIEMEEEKEKEKEAEKEQETETTANDKEKEKEASGTGSAKKINGVDAKGVQNQNNCPIIFYPYEIYDNCSFFVSDLPDPSDFAHFFFSKIADNSDWPHPRFPLRIMPVQVVCKLQQKAIETTVMPILEQVFSGDEAIRFSFILHTRKPSSDMTLHEVEAIIRNCLWSINPNCVQCLKYQDFAIMLEIVDSLLMVGVAREFNQLGRYNSAGAAKGRDLKEQMEDSEDDISDDPNLSEDGNVKRKLDIKRKRRMEKAAEEAQIAKQSKTTDDGDGKPEAMEVEKEDVNGDK